MSKKILNLVTPGIGKTSSLALGILKMTVERTCEHHVGNSRS